MKKKEKVVEEKPYSPLLFLKDFIVLEIILLYAALMLGDAFRTATDLGSIITRYVPIALVTLITTFTIVKTKTKKLKKSEEELTKRCMKIAPVIMAVILVVYGLYSVQSNLKNLRQESYWWISEELYSSEIVQNQLNTAANEARMNWVITGVIYLFSAEIVVFMMSKKLNTWLKDDMIPNNIDMYATDEFNIQNNFTSEAVNNTEMNNNINWDL